MLWSFAALPLFVGDPEPSLASSLDIVSVPFAQQAPSLDSTAPWSGARELQISQDFTFRRQAQAIQRIAVVTDTDNLYVQFSVTQADAPLATAHTNNNSSVMNDDYVGVYLYPDGSDGFAYSFIANAIGTRYQSSSENTAFSPAWNAVGEQTPDGYRVALAIPYKVMKSHGKHHWKAQFIRYDVRSTGLDVWTYSPNETYATDPSFAGTLTDIPPVRQTRTSTKPQARAQVYALGQTAGGGQTAASRAGADFSLPIATTATVLASIHPDYSDVEVDQQTISPTVFARQYSEVRPFFTQLTGFNAHIGCYGCPVSLYSPSIPAFAEGYAVEGSTGKFTYAGFDTQSTGRVDQAGTMDYNVASQRDQIGVDLQTVEVHNNGVIDSTTTLNSGYINAHSHLFAFVNLGVDRGSDVTSPATANYGEAGFGYASAQTSAVLDLKDEGAQYLPYDGYVSQPDLRGLRGVVSQTWTTSAGSAVRDVSVNLDEARYFSHAGDLAQVKSFETLGVDLKDQISADAELQTYEVRDATGSVDPFNTSGLVLGYQLQTSAPAYVTYSQGAYYRGTLNSWSYFLARSVARRFIVSGELDENTYASSQSSQSNIKQWFERTSLDFQATKEASFDIGLRSIFGADIPNAYTLPTFVQYRATNFSAAFHFLNKNSELFMAYGDANSLQTRQAITVKYVRYFGASKGT